MKQLKGRVAAVAASLLVASGMTLVAAVPANAATVPNRFYCDPADNYCYQVNGAYVFGLPIQCHWKLSGMAGKPHQRPTSHCNSWGATVA